MNKSFDYRKESEERFLPGLPLVVQLTFPKRETREILVRKIAEQLRATSVVFGDLRACFLLILPLRWGDCLASANKQDLVSLVASWAVPGTMVRAYQVPTGNESENLLRCIVTELGDNVSRLNRVDMPMKYSPEEIDRLPPRHAARSNPDLTVVRSVYVEGL